MTFARPSLVKYFYRRQYLAGGRMDLEKIRSIMSKDVITLVNLVMAKASNLR